MKMVLVIVLFGIFIAYTNPVFAVGASGKSISHQQSNQISRLTRKHRRWALYAQQARVLWRELQSLRYKDDFHKFGYAPPGVGGVWIRKERILRKEWGGFAKTLTDGERFTCDIAYITSQMYMVGYDWFKNDGKNAADTERNFDEINTDLRACPGNT